MDILGKLFGSDTKVKIMRLFLFNPETPFTNEDVVERARTSVLSTRHDLGILRKIKLVKSKVFVRSVARKNGKQNKFARKKVWGWILNQSFPYLTELERLLIDASLMKGEELVRKLSSSGRLKLVILSGLFIQNPDRRADILVVGDHLRHGSLEHTLRSIEAEIGKELRYAIFETGEFKYRLGMYDKLVRDILDYPHKTVLDRIGLPPTDVGADSPVTPRVY